MPRLIDVQEIVLEWSDFALWKQRIMPKSAGIRSNGIHLSGIIKQLMAKLPDETTDPPLCVAEGMAWENWVVGLPFCSGVRWQPGEWECDGVYGTPDGLEKTTLWEFKRTSISLRTYPDPLKYVRWKWQVAGNLHAMGLERVKLCVNWSRGDYRANRGCLYVYTYEFPFLETGELWNKMILPNKGLAKAEEHK